MTLRPSAIGPRRSKQLTDSGSGAIRVSATISVCDTIPVCDTALPSRPPPVACWSAQHCFTSAARGCPPPQYTHAITEPTITKGCAGRDGDLERFLMERPNDQADSHKHDRSALWHDGPGGLRRAVGTRSFDESPPCSPAPT